MTQLLEQYTETLLQVSISTAAVLGVLLLLLPVWHRRYSARWRKAIWLMLALRLLIPFSPELPQQAVQLELDLQSAPVRYAVQPDSHNVVAGETDSATVQPVNTSTAKSNVMVQGHDLSAKPPMAQPLSWGVLLFVVWLAGASGCLLWHGAQYRAFYGRVMQSAQPLQQDQWLLQQIGAELNLRSLPAVKLSAAVQGPMLLGFAAPTILLPQKAYAIEELSFILRHELTHYQQRDLYYKLTLLMANAVHWFNPLVWLMVRQANRDVEQVCDEKVVRHRDMAYRKAYSMTILQVMSNQRGVALSTYLSKQAQSGKRRFANILYPKQVKRGITALTVIALLAVIAGGCLQVGKLDEAEKAYREIKPYLSKQFTIDEAVRLEQWQSNDKQVYLWIQKFDDEQKPDFEIRVEKDLSGQIVDYMFDVLANKSSAEDFIIGPYLSEEQAQQIAEAFLTGLTGEKAFTFQPWQDDMTHYNTLSAAEFGWVADGAEADMHYEIMVDKQLGCVSHYRKYYDDAALRKQMADWLIAKATEAFDGYPRLSLHRTTIGMFDASRQGNEYEAWTPISIPYYGEEDDSSAETVWGESTEASRKFGKMQDLRLNIKVTAPIQADNTLDLSRCQIYTPTSDEAGKGEWMEIPGFEVFIGKSNNAIYTLSGSNYDIVNLATQFVSLIERAGKNDAHYLGIERPDYHYMLDSNAIYAALDLDFRSKYGQFGNNREDLEPVVLEIELPTDVETTDHLTMTIEKIDGYWRVTAASLETL